jgi:hypothetical protein
LLENLKKRDVHAQREYIGSISTDGSDRFYRADAAAMVPVLDRTIDQTKEDDGKANRVRNFDCRQNERLTFESLIPFVA